MKKILSVTVALFTLFLITNIGQADAAQPKKYQLTAKTPYVSESVKPAIAKYKKGDYTGAMIELEELLKKEKKNTVAKYYLALCYTKLGYRSNAENIYNEIIEANENLTLVYYSKRAINCIDNPEGEGCSVKVDYSKVVEKEQPQYSDLDKFIRSGQQFHPSVQDQITRERLERKIQEDEYLKKQGKSPTNINIKSEAPTNEEIAAALNTLSKIGINPYQQGYSMANLMANPYQYYPSNNTMPYSMMLGANPEMAKMMLYNQMNRQISRQFSAPDMYSGMSGFGL